MKSALFPSAKPPKAKQKSTLTRSKTDWDRLESQEDLATKSAEHPEASLDHIVRGIVRRGLNSLPAKAALLQNKLANRF